MIKTLAELNQANQEYHSGVRDSVSAQDAITVDPVTHAMRKRRGAELRFKKTIIKHGSGSRKTEKADNQLKASRAAHKVSYEKDPHFRHGKYGESVPSGTSERGVKQHPVPDAAPNQKTRGGQVVVHHDETVPVKLSREDLKKNLDSTPMQRVNRKESNPNKFAQSSEVGQRKLAANFLKGGGPVSKQERKTQLLESNIGRTLRGQDSRDSFPASDKTIADVNAVNKEYYNGNHTGMAQDVVGPISKPTIIYKGGAKSDDPILGSSKTAMKIGEPAERAQMQGPISKFGHQEMLHQKKMAESPLEFKGKTLPGRKFKGVGYQKHYEDTNVHKGDSFPASDKTIADVNDANKEYYNGKSHGHGAGF